MHQHPSSIAVRLQQVLALAALAAIAALATGCQSSCPTWASSLGATDHPRYPSSRFATWVGVAESETDARVKAIQGVSSQLKVEFSEETLRKATVNRSGTVQLSGSSRADMRTGNLVIRHLRLTQARCPSIDHGGERAHFILAAFDRGEVHREASKRVSTARPGLREKLKAVSEASDPQRTDGSMHVICAPGGRVTITSSNSMAQAFAEIALVRAELRGSSKERLLLQLPPAKYNVRCTAAGFQSQLQRVRIRPRVTTNVHFTLEPNDELHYIGEDLARFEKHVAPDPEFTISPAVPHFGGANLGRFGLDGAGIEVVRLTVRAMPEPETIARFGFEGSFAPGLTFNDEAAARIWLHAGPWFRPFGGNRGATFEVNPRLAASWGELVDDGDLDENPKPQPRDNLRLSTDYVTLEAVANIRTHRWLRLSVGYGWLWAWSDLGIWSEKSDGRYEQELVEESLADHALYARIEFDGRLDSFPSRLVPMSFFVEGRATLGALSGNRSSLVDASAGLVFKFPPGPEGL